MEVIYIDVLIVLNIYITFFLIKATARISHTPSAGIRTATASVAGSIFSLLILTDLNLLTVYLIKVFAAFLITYIAFGKQERIRFIKLTASFYIMNFIFAGLIMGIGDISSSDSITVKSTVIYYDVSLLSLIVFTALSYLLICMIRFILDKSTVTDDIYYISVINCDRTVTLKGMADTGNTLVDAFSGRPVIICPPEIIFQLTGSMIKEEDLYSFLVSDSRIKGARLIPFSTISGDGAVPAFIPEKVIISNKKVKRNADVIIGINSAQKDAIFNPRLIF